jgi:GNAT superfamily N-acetyltransferase
MSQPVFLQEAMPRQLEEAAAWNHREFFIFNALAHGGEIREEEGVTWTLAGPGGEIPFPGPSDDRAGDVLDSVIQSYLERQSKHLIGCWSLEPPQPLDLGVRLLARGFQPGWQPCWMSCDLKQLNADHPKPEGLVIEVDRGEGVGDVPNLPNPASKEASIFVQTDENYRDRYRHFIARLEGRVVGHSSVFLSEGPLGVAGIYDVGVVPEARNQGIGKAVTAAACLQAKSMGYRYALLNATGRRMYEQIGFQHVGDGQTWWLDVPRLAAHPPTKERIALAEAVGRGDIEALDALHRQGHAKDLDAPLTNEMTLIELAVDSGQPSSAEWLISHGVPLHLVTAWDLGWKDRVKQRLDEDAEQVNALYGSMQTTPLHEAIFRDDVEFVKLLLAYNPNLDVEDLEYHSTPLGWATHMNRAEIVELLRQHVSGTGT